MAMCIDGLGKLWVGGDNGIAILDKNDFHALPINNEVDKNRIIALHKTSNADIIAGTFGDGLIIFNPIKKAVVKKIKFYNPDHSFVTSVAGISDTAIYAGTIYGLLKVNLKCLNYRTNHLEEVLLSYTSCWKDCIPRGLYPRFRNILCHLDLLL